MLENPPMKKTKKITKATFKSFVSKNLANLFVNVRSNFDGRTDCVESVSGGFRLSITNGDSLDNPNTRGIDGIWLVGGRGNYFKAYDDGAFTGIEVSNCCGLFIVAIAKN